MNTPFKQSYSQIGSFLDSFADPEMRSDLGVIIVTHLLPDRHMLLDSLSKLSHIIAVIPKQKSIHIPTLEKLENTYNFEFLSRSQIAETEVIDELIEKSNLQKIILLDIGGYFAPIINRLKQKFGEKIVGVIEDTENGHQKYQDVDATVPIISVARSPLKEQEDYLVGQSIFYSTEAILREVNVLPNYLNLGVLGYGKIGKSVANLAKSKCRYVAVYDTNPILLAQAACHGFVIPSFKKLLEESDVIISCTGNKAINDTNISFVKDGCFISSATSADDEFALNNTLSHSQARSVNPHIHMIQNREKHFYLMNQGNAVNFLHNAVVGDFIFLVQSEILFAMKELYYNKSNYSLGIGHLKDDQRSGIAEKFIYSLTSKFN